MVVHDPCNHVWFIGHYKTYNISKVGHPRSNLVGLLMLWMVIYNIQSTGIVLYVPQNIVNPVKHE